MKVSRFSVLARVVLHDDWKQMTATSSLLLESVRTTGVTSSMTDSWSALQITFSGTSLFLIVSVVVASMHLLDPGLTTWLIIGMLACVIVSKDFQDFLSLGPGGTPSTIYGYAKITCLRLFALRDPLSPPFVPPMLRPQTGHLSISRACIPRRNGVRPVVAGVAPQRQLNQYGCPIVHVKLRQSFNNAAAARPDLLYTSVSCFEKQGLALFAKQALNRTCNGEICHVHASDKSLHISLHPADAKIVLERGWGQRHPLARGGWLRRFVPKEFMMIYAPRSDDEAEVVCRIVEAASWWVMGEKVSINCCDAADLNEHAFSQGFDSLALPRACTA